MRCVGVAALLLVPAAVKAQFTVESLGTQLGLGEADLKDTVLNILRWVLGIAGLLAVATIIIGGANYIISGDSEPVKTRARRLILSGIIGLVIILLAWAVVIFVARTTANVTQP